MCRTLCTIINRHVDGTATTMTRNHIRASIVCVVKTKTGKRLDIPVANRLKDSLDAWLPNTTSMNLYRRLWACRWTQQHFPSSCAKHTALIKADK